MALLIPIQGWVVQSVQLRERRTQGGIPRDASLEHIWPSWADGKCGHSGRVQGWHIFTLFQDFNCSFFDQNLLYLPRQEPLLSRLPNYCKIKNKLPPMDKVMRLMHLARYCPEDPSWNPCSAIPWRSNMTNLIHLVKYHFEDTSWNPFSSNPMEIKHD